MLRYMMNVMRYELQELAYEGEWSCNCPSSEAEQTLCKIEIWIFANL